MPLNLPLRVEERKDYDGDPYFVIVDATGYEVVSARLDGFPDGHCRAIPDMTREEAEALASAVNRSAAADKLSEALEFWIDEATSAGGEAVPRKFNWIKSCLAAYRAASEDRQ